LPIGESGSIERGRIAQQCALDAHFAIIIAGDHAEIGVIGV
jgi:hypothetical protein